MKKKTLHIVQELKWVIWLVQFATLTFGSHAYFLLAILLLTFSPSMVIHNIVEISHRNWQLFSFTKNFLNIQGRLQITRVVGPSIEEGLLLFTLIGIFSQHLYLIQVNLKVKHTSWCHHIQNPIQHDLHQQYRERGLYELQR